MLRFHEKSVSDDVSPRNFCQSNQHVLNISLEKGTLTNQDSAELTLTSQSNPSFAISSKKFLVKSQDIRFLVEMPENVELGDYDLKVEIPNKTIPILREAVEIIQHFYQNCTCLRKELKSVEGKKNCSNTVWIFTLTFFWQKFRESNVSTK